MHTLLEHSEFYRLHGVHALDTVDVVTSTLPGFMCCTKPGPLRHAPSRTSMPASIRRRRILTGIICDQTISLDLLHPSGLPSTSADRFKDPESGKTLVFITNNFSLPAATICALYKSRWQVELFFNWIKQLFGSSSSTKTR